MGTRVCCTGADALLTQHRLPDATVSRTQNLRNRRCYAAGWLQMSEVAEGGAAGPRSAGLRCQSCSGVGAKPCSACDGTGRAALVVL